MATRHPKFSAAVLIAALQLGSCTDADDSALGSSNSLRASVLASDVTRQTTGIVEWRVRVEGHDTLVVVGIDGGATEVGRFVMQSTPDEVRIDAHGASVGRVRLVRDGSMLEYTLDDAALLDAFRSDGAAQQLTPRDAGPSSCAETADDGMACGNFLAADLDEVLGCSIAIAGAALECLPGAHRIAAPAPRASRQGGGEGGGAGGGGGAGYDDGGGYDGGGYDDDGGYDGGGYDGGGYDGGGYDGGGYDGGGYDGGGYDGGGYDGGGYDGGGYDGGGYDGGGYDGGGGGYDGGGYDGGGYDGGGYGGGYDGVRRPGPRVRLQTGIPQAPAEFAFGAGGTASAPIETGAWNLRQRRGR
jgi:hypothetical protein